MSYWNSPWWGAVGPHLGTYPYDPYGQFIGRKSLAAGWRPGNGGLEYTLEMFKEDFPEFWYTNEEGEVVWKIPESIIQQYIDAANESLPYRLYGAQWRLLAGLYVAHFAALRLQNYIPGDEDNPGDGGVIGGVVGNVTREQLGDSSVQRDFSSTEISGDWGMYNGTTYGKQFVTLLRPLGMAGIVVI